MVSYFKQNWRDADHIWRERELIAIDMEGRIDSLLEGQMDIMQRLREDERERDDSRDNNEFIVVYIDETDGIVREARERECNIRAKATGGLSEEITDLGKGLDRDQDESGIDGAAFASAEDKVCRHDSNIYRVR